MIIVLISTPGIAGVLFVASALLCSTYLSVDSNFSAMVRLLPIIGVNAADTEFLLLEFFFDFIELFLR